MLRRTFLCLSVSFVASAAWGARSASVSPLAPGASVRKLIYDVRHSKYGALGKFSNTIVKTGDKTTVTTDAHFRVGAVGLTFYRQDASRVETWQGGRLMAFHGVTSENGKSVELTGRAEGDHFVMTTPDGDVVAPSDIRIANPWSRGSVNGGVMLTPDRGRLEKITLSDMDQADLRIGSKLVRTQHFAVIRGKGPRRYEIWLDEEDTPVQFALVTPNNTVTFTLQG